ncbi:MAG: hypothetical protein J3Q66DRAFT_369220 [Benniella sp.]|nr:MAG: hypothetical protein J3Q66DRAFT_369220 [Benniella sp.]
MPGLNDKIFLPISIFVLNIILAVFSFVLLCAVGAAFAIYSKYGGEYANSVRWTRSAGYLEMIKTTIGSSKSTKIPRSTKMALVVGLFATVVASFLDKGIAHFVNPAIRHGSDSTRILVVSPQLASNTKRKTFAGWTFVVPKDGNITETMEKALTGSLAIPDAKSDRFYTPVTADYTINCASFNLTFEGISITEDGCVKLFPYLSSNTSYYDYVLTKRSPNQWSILLNSELEPYNTRVAALEAPIEILEYEDQCVTFESTRLRSYGDIQDGISSFPTTSTSQCVLSTGDVAVLSMTSTRFTFADKEYNINLASEMFADTSDELLLAMNETFKTKTIPPQVGVAASNRSVELWVELQAMNSSVDILACAHDAFRWNASYTARNVECVYHTINAFVMSQPFNPKIQEVAMIPKEYYQGTFMILDHVPDIHNGIRAPISLAKLRSDTAAVSDYMARLGTNLYVDYEEEKFYAEYDVVDVQSGLEVPLWVLVVSGFILIVSFILWQLTYWLVDSAHTSSLYRIMSKRMASQTDTPVLLRAKLEPREPLELEGVVLLPGEGIQGTDPKNKP